MQEMLPEGLLLITFGGERNSCKHNRRHTQGSPPLSPFTQYPQANQPLGSFYSKCSGMANISRDEKLHLTGVSFHCNPKKPNTIRYRCLVELDVNHFAPYWHFLFFGGGDIKTIHEMQHLALCSCFSHLTRCYCSPSKI